MDIGKVHRQGEEPLFNIVLHNPDIPHNTGAIGRICVNLNVRLHLIEPLGFKIEEKHIKRCGMDYWQHLDLTIHKSWDDFLTSEAPEKLCFLTTKTEKTYFEHTFSQAEYIVFGSESRGLPTEFYPRYADELLTIPMPGKFARSQNLANSVAITAYEAYRQISL